VYDRNYVAILQEHLQKLGKKLPEYEFDRVGGEDHVPLFVSHVFIGKKTTFSGSPKSSKILAKQDAARVAVESYNL